MGNKEQPAADSRGEEGDGGTAAPDSPVWQSCGQQRFYIQDDVLFWESHGATTVQDLKVFFEQRTALQSRRGRVFLLVDARDLASFPAETRKHAVTFKPAEPLRGAIVVFGAGLLVRTAVSLVLSAGRLLGRRNLNSVFFVADESEGRALIDSERLALESSAN